MRPRPTWPIRALWFVPERGRVKCCSVLVVHHDKSCYNSFGNNLMPPKGQVTMPERIRESPSLEAGSRLAVAGNKDVEILKRIAVPASSEFGPLIRPARLKARAAGLKKIGHWACNSTSLRQKVRIILDINVLMPGIFSGGPPFRTPKAWRNCRLQQVMRLNILLEYQPATAVMGQKYTKLTAPLEGN